MVLIVWNNLIKKKKRIESTNCMHKQRLMISFVDVFNALMSNDILNVARKYNFKWTRWEKNTIRKWFFTTNTRIILTIIFSKKIKSRQKTYILKCQQRYLFSLLWWRFSWKIKNKNLILFATQKAKNLFDCWGKFPCVYI